MEAQPVQLNAFDQKAAWQHLLKQLEFGPRVPGTKGHLNCRDWILAELKANCDEGALQEFSHKWSVGNVTKTMWNIYGSQNWKTAKTRVLLIAHWDTRPFADQEFDSAKASKPIPGANDGASGVAVLLELARAMKWSRNADVGVMYLFTDGEDLGPSLDEMFLGARAFAKNLPNPKPDYGILLDMIGDKDLEIPMEPNSMRYAPELMKAFYAFAKSKDMASTFPNKVGPEIMDDHLAINEAGIPTIDLIDFDYEYWHTLGDTADKCSADSLGKVGKILQGWLTQKPSFTIKK